ncbi:MAG: hypothetical protein KDH18_24955, partial [Rhodoferax sp.]|nr:hypothetical protein [Rhodoferax sp.]
MCTHIVHINKLIVHNFWSKQNVCHAGPEPSLCAICCLDHLPSAVWRSASGALCPDSGATGVTSRRPPANRHVGPSIAYRLPHRPGGPVPEQAAFGAIADAGVPLVRHVVSHLTGACRVPPRAGAGDRCERDRIGGLGHAAILRQNNGRARHQPQEENMRITSSFVSAVLFAALGFSLQAQTTI